MSRSCGDCTVCCTYLRISVLEKKGLTPCQHLKDPAPDGYTGSGCSVYETKPDVCHAYHCAWLDGHGEEADRPDRSGMLIDNVLRIDNTLQCKPLRKGAQDTHEGMVAVERVVASARKVGLVAGFPETHMIRAVGLPPEPLKRCKRCGVELRINPNDPLRYIDHKCVG